MCDSGIATRKNASDSLKMFILTAIIILDIRLLSMSNDLIKKFFGLLYQHLYQHWCNLQRTLNR